MKNCTLIGYNVGADLPEDSEHVVIIGDNIRSLDKNQENVTFIGDFVAIGETIGGKPINLRSVLREAFKDEP